MGTGRRVGPRRFASSPARVGGSEIRPSAVADRAQPDRADALAGSAPSRTIGGNSALDGGAALAKTINSSNARDGPEAAAVFDPRLAYTVNDTVRMLSVSRSTINKMIKLKLLKTIRLLGRRLVLRASIEDLLAGNDK